MFRIFLLFVIVIIVPNVFCQDAKFPALPKCEDFDDKRHPYISSTPTIFIPLNRTEDGIYANEETYRRVVYPLRTVLLKCERKDRRNRTILFDYSRKDFVTSTSRSFLTVESGTTLSPSRSYFTKMSYFFDEDSRIYYRPDGEYCVKSISQTEMTLDVCEISSKCAGPSRLCLPKCCALGELLSLPSKKCIQASQVRPPIGDRYESSYNEDDSWNPSIYSDNSKVDATHNLTLFYFEVDNGTEMSLVRVPTSKVSFRLSTLPKSCNSKTQVGKGVPHKSPPYFKWYGSDDDLNGRNDLRSIVNGTARLTLPRSKKSGDITVWWHDYDKHIFKVKENTAYCVDDYYIENSSKQRNHETGSNSFIVAYCEGISPIYPRSDGYRLSSGLSYVLCTIISLIASAIGMNKNCTKHLA